MNTLQIRILFIYFLIVICFQLFLVIRHYIVVVIYISTVATSVKISS